MSTHVRTDDVLNCVQNTFSTKSWKCMFLCIINISELKKKLFCVCQGHVSLCNMYYSLLGKPVIFAVIHQNLVQRIFNDKAFFFLTA